jgi:hypothetical protein
MNYPRRHVSIRVPWHDTAWEGRVCANPRLNGSCLKLKGIGQKRNDAAEEAVAGQRRGQAITGSLRIAAPQGVRRQRGRRRRADVSEGK